MFDEEEYDKGRTKTQASEKSRLEKVICPNREQNSINCPNRKS